MKKEELEYLYFVAVSAWRKQKSQLKEFSTQAKVILTISSDSEYEKPFGHRSEWGSLINNGSFGGR
jgi:hypothetical protein